MVWLHWQTWMEHVYAWSSRYISITTQSIANSRKYKKQIQTHLHSYDWNNQDSNAAFKAFK